LRLVENGDLSFQRVGHREVSIKFAEGSGEFRDPINVLANSAVRLRARSIGRADDSSMNLRWSFLAGRDR
jgi:hypothetical protein